MNACWLLPTTTDSRKSARCTRSTLCTEKSEACNALFPLMWLDSHQEFIRVRWRLMFAWVVPKGTPIQWTADSQYIFPSVDPGSRRQANIAHSLSIPSSIHQPFVTEPSPTTTLCNVHLQRPCLPRLLSRMRTYKSPCVATPRRARYCKGLPCVSPNCQ